MTEPASQPPAPPDLRAGLTHGLAIIALGLAAAGVAWALSGGIDLSARARPSKIAPYELKLDAGVPVDAEIAFWTERLKGKPHLFIERNLLAGCYLRKARETGDEAWYAKAEEQAAASLKALPVGNADAELVRAQVAVAFHRFPEARRIVEDVARRHPQAGYGPLLATIDLSQGRTAAAAKLLEEMVRRGPSSAAFAQLGLARAARGDDRGAEEAFRQAIAREQTGERLTSADARTWLGRLWLRRGRLDEALDLFTEALRIYPRHPQAIGLVGDVLARRKDFAGADERWRLAGELRHDPAPELARARIARAAGRVADAEKLWADTEAFLREDLAGGHVDHRRDLARLLLDRGRPADAAEAERICRAERAVREDAETLDLHAGALLSLGRHQEAESAMKLLDQTGAREAPYKLRRAAIARALGEAARAESLVAEADALDPTFRADPAFPAYDLAAVR